MIPDVPLLHRSRRLPSEISGVLLEVTPEQAGWPLIHFAVRQLAAGATWRATTGRQEVCLVLLSGRCRARWNLSAPHQLGPRGGVFDSYPHAAYLPAGTDFEVVADERTELAECSAPSDARTLPRLVPPDACGFEIRGGGNAIDMYRRHAARVWHVHFKDCDPRVFERMRGESWDYFDAMRHGIFCELGRGRVDFPAVLRELRAGGYDDWIVVEQDVLPGMGAPADSARRNREFLRGLGV